METPVLKIEGIKKRLSNEFSLDVPYMEFKEGNIYGLIGPNGAGKSTLLKILNLLEAPDEGEIFFNGNPVTPSNLVETRKNMGMVMENPYLFHTTVFKNVAAGLKFRSTDKGSWDATVKEALVLVGLDGFESRDAPDLSRGESQRVTIARILAFKPKILFLDEPFSNIDRKHALILEELIKNINKESATTIVFTTHNIIQATLLSDQILAMREGRISERGDDTQIHIYTKLLSNI